MKNLDNKFSKETMGKIKELDTALKEQYVLERITDPKIIRSIESLAASSALLFYLTGRKDAFKASEKNTFVVPREKGYAHRISEMPKALEIYRDYGLEGFDK